MSAPPFFQSAGRGDLFFWDEKEGPTVVIWESLLETEKKSWLEESSTMHDWVVWCKSSKKKAHRGQSVRYRSWRKQGNIKMAVSEDHA